MADLGTHRRRFLLLMGRCTIINASKTLMMANHPISGSASSPMMADSAIMNGSNSPLMAEVAIMNGSTPSLMVDSAIMNGFGLLMMAESAIISRLEALLTAGNHQTVRQRFVVPLLVVGRSEAPMPELPIFVSFNLVWLGIWALSAWGLARRLQIALFPLWFLGIASVANGLLHPLLAEPVSAIRRRRLRLSRPSGRITGALSPRVKQ